MERRIRRSYHTHRRSPEKRKKGRAGTTQIQTGILQKPFGFTKRKKKEEKNKTKENVGAKEEKNIGIILINISILEDREL